MLEKMMRLESRLPISFFSVFITLLTVLAISITACGGNSEASEPPKLEDYSFSYTVSMDGRLFLEDQNQDGIVDCVLNGRPTESGRTVLHRPGFEICQYASRSVEMSEELVDALSGHLANHRELAWRIDSARHVANKK